MKCTETVCAWRTLRLQPGCYQLLFKAAGENSGCQFAQQTLSSQVNEKHRVPGGRCSASACEDDTASSLFQQSPTRQTATLEQEMPEFSLKGRQKEQRGRFPSRGAGLISSGRSHQRLVHTRSIFYKLIFSPPHNL